MKKHVKVYLNHFDLGEQDVILCEVCQRRAVDVHHIDGRGPGKDVIENLVGLCRDCHIRAGNDKAFNNSLKLLRIV